MRFLREPFRASRIHAEHSDNHMQAAAGDVSWSDWLRAAIALLCAGAAGSVLAAGTNPERSDAEFSAWVQDMKTDPLGPFLGVRWFCADGAVLPPREYACRSHGGGRQSGQRDARAEAIRAAGIPIATVLSELTPETALANDAQLLKAVLLEQFLIDIDDGWILRRARYVRGVTQAEDEMESARRILLALAQDPRSADTRFTLLREAVRLLPKPFAPGSFREARALADELAQRDKTFRDLRNLIHSRPAADLSARVRAHASALPEGELRAQFDRLAADLDAAFAHTALADRLHTAAAALAAPELQALAARYAAAHGGSDELAVLTEILVRIRDSFGTYPANRRVLAMDLSLEAEQAAFAATRRAPSMQHATRRERLLAFMPLTDVLYGSGLLTGRERDAILAALAAFDGRYTSTGDYSHLAVTLGRIPGWTANRLGFHFAPTVRTFARIEPRARALIPDRLRSSVALRLGEALEAIGADADRQRGVRHELFGEAISTGLRALNPGLARGTLLRAEAARAAVPSSSIVLAPETTADLPAVAGILTESEGNALSHVQLLARNLGLPNVVVGSRHLAALNARVGTPIVLAASPGGVVRIAADGPEWGRWFAPAPLAPARIDVDPRRLDLSLRRPIPLRSLQATDAGRIVGPKAANLGTLAARYPQMVAPAIAIPFGVYRQLLDAPGPDRAQPMFEWMRAQYRALGRIEDAAWKASATRAFLETVRAWFTTVEFPDGLVDQLRAMTEASFGADGSYGLYIRSDTNLEDLPGFTGAGLNRTVPNVVSFDQVLAAIREVWTSPFSERAYGWRQAAMDEPEHVYVSVLLQLAVPSEKSGVMVTTDTLSGEPGFISIVANEGAGGAVDGQNAESLRLRLQDERPELLSSATEPMRRVTLREGGLREMPASGSATLLDADERHRLAEVARSIPTRYPQLRDADGHPAPADVEFAFAGGRLYLMQIRPFLENPRAQRNAFLRSLDAGTAERRDALVDLDAVP